MMWVESSRPRTVEELIGNEEARLAIIKWLAEWVIGSKPLLLLGPPGVGKTTVVQALSFQFDYDLIEMNASDTRNREILLNRIIPAFKNTSLLEKKMLLFLDEVDGISGRQDIGGIEYLVSVLKAPTIPVIMAANSRDTKIRDLAKISKVIEFEPIHPRLLLLYINHILKKHNVTLSPEDKFSIVRSSNGDVRALLNNAQSISAGYDAYKEDSFDVDIKSAVNLFFSCLSAEEAKKILSRTDAIYIDPRFGISSDERRRDIVNALFSSILSSRVDISILAIMLDILSKIDVLVGRMGTNRQWSLLKYFDTLIAYGLFYISRNKAIKYSQYNMAWPLMGPILARGQSLKKLAGDLAQAAHTSKSTFSTLYLPYLIQVMINNEHDPRIFATSSNLDEKAGEVLAKEMSLLRKRNG
ncbi:MAG TPA: AAA family ATPase [Candidatus Nitrosopolaris sp.]